MAKEQLDLNRLFWLGLGAGSKGLTAGMVSGLVPQAGISPEIVAGGVGFWLATQGGQRMGPFGEGMLVAAIGQMLRQPIESIFGRIAGPQTPAPETLAPKKAAAESGPESEADYLAAKYGIT